jgi:hypothetical protein
LLAAGQMRNAQSPWVVADPKPELADVSQLIWLPDPVSSSCRRPRHQIPTQIPTAEPCDRMKRANCMGKSFAVIWGELERISPRLARRPLTPRNLPGQIHTAKVMLQRLRRAPEWVQPLLTNNS